ncbi:MAG: cytochrome c family protein [Rhodobacterales bacterium]|nr:cytochrome c family protein [Rhodobacterales bacterium]
MFDTMTMVKVTGGVFGALLVFLLGSWAADTLYTTGGGHVEGAEQAYAIEVEGDEASEEVVEEGPSFTEMMAAADVAKGAKVFGKCKACHKIEAGVNATGPSLFGVVDRAVGTADGFAFSGKLVAVASTWDAETLFEFLRKPKEFAPGTKMSFSGLKKEADRVNLIAYLATLSE